MLLHGQARKMALEGAIVPGSIVFTAWAIVSFWNCDYWCDEAIFRVSFQVKARVYRRPFRL
jgi:hypothetical protein